MSQRVSSSENWGKALMYATSHEDDSSDDEIEFCKATLTAGRRRSVETANVSSKSHTVSSRASSWHRPAKRRGASRGDMRAVDLLINIDANFFGDEVHANLGARRRSLRPRFPPH